MSTPERFVRECRGLTKSILLILSAVSGYFTYLGAALVLDAGGIDWHSRASAAVFAIGVAAGIYLFWNYALYIVPGLPSRRTRALGMAITALGCLFLVSLSSWLNVTALAGAGALEVHMSRALSAFEETLAASYDRGRRIEQLVPDLDMEAGRFERLAGEEIRHGTLSGVPGRGTVSETLNGAAVQLRALAEQIRQGLARSETLAAQGRESLNRLRAVLGSAQSAAKRMDGFAGEANHLRALLAELAAQDLAGSVARKAVFLPETMGSRALSRRSKRVAKAQGSSLEAIRQDLASTGEALARAAQDIASLPEVAAPVFERPSVVTAVLHYSGSFVPYWAGGVSLDLLPTLLILFLMLVFTSRDGPDGPGSRIDNLTVRELREAHEAMEELKKPRKRLTRNHERKED